MTLLVLVLSAIATISKADGFCVVSIDPDYKETVLKDVTTGMQWNAKIGNEIGDWRIEGITENFVTISKLYKGIILMTRLPVPARDFGYRQKLPAYMNNVPASSSSGSIKSR